MRKTNVCKKIITIAGIAALSLSALICPANTIVVEAATEETTVSPCADNIEWRFKKENGKLYRRLYNSSTLTWIGEWEYVCDL